MKLQFNEVPHIGDVLWAENDDEKIVISFVQDHLIQRIFRNVFRMKIPKQKDLVFDEKTSCIWKLIDGQKTLKEIYDLFALQIGEEQTEDLKVRFGTVIHYFISQKWIIIKEESYES